MTRHGAAGHPLGEQDGAALIGMTALLEGHLLSGGMAPHLVDSLNRHLQRAGLVESGAGPAELRLALADLNQRLRYVLGEHDESPAPGTGQVDQYFGFASVTAAHAFAESARARSESAASPVAVDGGAYDGEVRWQVAVRTAELPLSAEFDDHVVRLRALAAEHGGTYGGWGSAAD
jgi:hypothetical protein